MGDNTKSIEAFIAALRIDPENMRIYNNLGLVFSKIGRHEEAFEAFKKGKDEAGAYNNLGYVYMTEQSYAKAIEAFERAMELNPGFYEKANQNIQKAKAAMKVATKPSSAPAIP
jgi:tetratricopeptide (TPR) repeat protein